MGDTPGAGQAGEGLDHVIDRDIYGMPAFASLQVSDLAGWSPQVRDSVVRPGGPRTRGPEPA